MVPPKHHSSRNQPRAKGKFVSKNSSDAGDLNNDDSMSFPSGSHSSDKNVGEAAASSILAKLPSIQWSLPPPTIMASEAPQEAQQDDEPPPMSLQAVYEKWGGRLRPRDDYGRVVYPSTSRTRETNLVKKLANISLGTTDTDDAGSDGSPDPDSSSDEDEDGSSPEENREIQYGRLEQPVAAGLDDALEMANDVLRSDKLYELEDLKDARDAVTTLSKTRQVLARYRAEHPKIKHVDAIPFSKLTWKHLSNMGINNKKSHVVDVHQKIEDAFELEVSNDRPLSEIFTPFWASLTQNTDYFELFEEILDFVGKQAEARARLLTDHVVLRVMIFLKKALSLVPLLFLELILSAVTDAKPVIIVHQDRATFITGSVDYAIISSSSAADELEKSEFKGQVGQLIKESTLENMLKQDKRLASQFKDVNQFKFTIIEEKRKDHTGSRLEKWEPQVVGEGLAIIRKTGRKYVPWCISNGEEWLFGLLTESSRGVESYRLPILSLHERSRKTDLETLFKLLIIWTAIPDRLIMNVFFIASEGIV